MLRLIFFFGFVSFINAQCLHGRYIVDGYAHLFNVIKISEKYALAPAHAFPAGDGVSLTVNNLPAKIIQESSDLTLVEIDRRIKLKSAVIADPFKLQNGIYTHRYYDFLTRRYKSRVVHCDDSSYIAEGFDEGMSGSGIYNDQNELVGIAEWKNGMFWNTVVIRGYFEYLDFVF